MNHNDQISIDMDNKVKVPHLHRSGNNALCAVLLIFLLTIPVFAHSPSQVLLAYDNLNQTLNVTITHTSSNTDSHYVREVVLQKNGNEILRREYTNQTTTTTFSYDYPVNATSGDLLKAAAYCSISGSRSAEIRIP